MKKKYSIFFILVLGISFAAKIVFLASDSLPWGDDLYYWLWFQHPFISYPDHPPLIGYLVGISTLIFGQHAFALALGGVIIYAILAFFGYFFAANLFSPRSPLAGFLFASSVSAVPYFAGVSVIMCPDTVLAFFAFFTLFAYHNAFFRQKNSPQAWILAGIFLSLALFSKLTTFFMGASIFLFACFSKKRKDYLSNPYFFLSFFPSVFVGIALLISDYSHDWAMIKYTHVRASSKTNFASTLNFLGNQFLHYSPLFFSMGVILSLRSVWQYFRSQPQQHSQNKSNSELRLNQKEYATNVPVTKMVGGEEAVFFFGFSTFYCFLIVVWSLTQTRMLNHWSSFFIFPAIFLVIFYSLQMYSRPWFKKVLFANFIFSIFYCCLATFHIVFGTLDHRYDETRNDTFRSYNIFLKKVSLWVHEKTGNYPKENSDWLFCYNTLKETTPESFLTYYQNEMIKDIPIITNNFRPAVYLEFYLPQAPHIVGLTNNNLSLKPYPQVGDQYSLYDIVVDYRDFVKKDAYVLIQKLSLFPNGNSSPTKVWMRENFAEVEKIKLFSSKRKGKTVEYFELYLAKNYQPSRLLKKQ